MRASCYRRGRSPDSGMTRDRGVRPRTPWDSDSEMFYLKCGQNAHARIWRPPNVSTVTVTVTRLVVQIFVGFTVLHPWGMNRKCSLAGRGALGERSQLCLSTTWPDLRSEPWIRTPLHSNHTASLWLGRNTEGVRAYVEYSPRRSEQLWQTYAVPEYLPFTHGRALRVRPRSCLCKHAEDVATDPRCRCTCAQKTRAIARHQADLAQRQRILNLSGSRLRDAPARRLLRAVYQHIGRRLLGSCCGVTVVRSSAAHDRPHFALHLLQLP